MLTLPPHPHPHQKIKGASPPSQFFFYFMIVHIDHKNVLMKLWSCTCIFRFWNKRITEIKYLSFFLRPVYGKSF